MVRRWKGTATFFSVGKGMGQVVGDRWEFGDAPLNPKDIAVKGGRGKEIFSVGPAR